MDPVSMILALAMRNPQLAAQAVDGYKTPGQVDVSRIQSSVADFAAQTLNCYHRSARFRGVEILGAPWAAQAHFGAQASVVLRIHFSGLTGTQYQMIVAAMAKDQAYRTFVVDENSAVPYNKRCELEYWTASAKVN